MPEVVIDAFEMIEVEEEDGKHIVLATFGVCHGSLQPLPEHGPVWQAGQRIMKGIV